MFHAALTGVGSLSHCDWPWHMTNDWHAAVLRFVCKGEERFPRHLVVNLNKVGTLLLESGDHGACVGGIGNVHGTDSSLVRKSSASMLNAGSIDKGTGDSYDSRPDQCAGG